MKLRLLIFTVLFSNHFSMNAQSFYEKGWVVTVSGDTLKGFIADENNKRLVDRVVFKRKVKDKPQYLKPTELKSFFIYPNQYFESHPVTINDQIGRKTNNVQHFLYRSEAGYISVFSMPIRKIIFLKKQGDTVLQPLFLTITTKDELNNARIDTLTNSNLNAYGTGTLDFRYNYIYVLSKLFNEGQTYSPKVFPLEESRIIYEVRQYNKAIHPQYKSNPLAIKEKRRPIWTVGLNYVAPLHPYYGVENLLSFGTKENLSPQRWEYEILVGIAGKKTMKGISIEASYSKMSKTKYLYSYKNSSNAGPDQIFDGLYETDNSIISFRVNYTTNITTKLSPYFSVILSGYNTVKTQFTKDRGTNVVQYLSNNESFFDLGLHQSLGLQYAITRKHVVRAELDFYLGDWDLNEGIIKVGYQYRFWK
jgi:hypothetical protein